jgi:hypothetical protein
MDDLNELLRMSATIYGYGFLFTSCFGSGRLLSLRALYKYSYGLWSSLGTLAPIWIWEFVGLEKGGLCYKLGSKSTKTCCMLMTEDENCTYEWLQKSAVLTEA